MKYVTVCKIVIYWSDLFYCHHYALKRLKVIGSKVQIWSIYIINITACLIYTKIIAPFDGTVSKEFLKKGALVGVGSPIIEIVSNKNFKILKEKIYQNDKKILKLKTL